MAQEGEENKVQTSITSLFNYWGQNSYGSRGNDTKWQQKDLGAYCEDTSVNVIPIAFLDAFFGPGGVPIINLANSCENATFPDTSLMDCSGLSPAITSCQNNGKIVTISLGGDSASVGFTTESQAKNFAKQIWDMFLGGQSEIRPFGSAILDGVDLDIEAGSADRYAAFVKQIKTLSMGAGKRYYITGAPQCPFPDAYLGKALSKVFFDMFYNNPCGLNHFDDQSSSGRLGETPKRQSERKRLKVYIGAPASMTSAGTGYVNASILGNIALHTQSSFPSFGGVMFWDMSQAYGEHKSAVYKRIAEPGTKRMITFIKQSKMSSRRTM
ncbi:glycoside hydrolase family 18 protein [Mycena olivaceomarginata]|nr:glycoside hydrolase family 18 protein [Mycena olivaceomarginata]